MSRKNFAAGTLLAPLPAVMVSVGSVEKPNIITIAWTGILASTPPKTYISVRPSRYSHGLIKENMEFVINLTTEKLVKETDYAGIYTGAKVNKFEKLGLHAIASNAVSAPTIEESPLSLECRVSDVISMGTHDVFIADIVNVSCDEKLLDEKGKICLERAGLMTYAHGEYYALGEKLGNFGLSAVKKKNSASLHKKPTKKEAPKCVEEKKEKRPFYETAPGYKRSKKRG